MKLEVFNKIIDRLEAITSRFDDDNADQVSTDEEVTEAMAEETSEETAQTFAEAVLSDGTLVQYEGELAPGTALFVVAEEGDLIPAPEGTHALGGDMEGVSVVVDADGLITEVIDEREGGDAEAAPAEEEMSTEQNIEEVIEEKMSEIAEPMNKIAEMIGSLKDENDALRSELESLRSEFTAFKDTPSEEFEEKAKFSRSNNMTRRERYLNNLRKMKQ